MANPLTDSLQLVEIVPVQSAWNLFTRRRYNAEDGFSLEVFRGNAHIGSILANATNSDVNKQYEQLAVRQSDTIYRVNLGPRLLNVTASLPMSDKFTRTYAGNIEICVSDPLRFIIQHRQNSDPVAIAQQAIIGALQRYARRTEHDEINFDNLCYEARVALSTSSHSRYGLQVLHVHEPDVTVDPRKGVMRDVIIKGQIDETRVNTQANVDLTRIQRNEQLQKLKDEHERERISTFADFGRKEEISQKQQERQQSMLNAVSVAVQKRIIQEISDGIPLEIIMRKYPEISQYGLPGLTPRNAEQSTPILLKPTPQLTKEEAVEGDYKITQSNTNPTLSALRPTSEHSLSLFRSILRATLIVTPLNAEQCEEWGIAGEAIFMVTEISTGGPAAQGYMRPGDIIIKINQQEVHTEQDINTLLGAHQTQMPLLIRVLRGGQPLDLEITL